MCETKTYQVRMFNIDQVKPPVETIAHPSASAWLARANTPIDLEIGCGVGWHPISYARENPDRRLIAIEHTRAKFERFQGRLNNQPELTNLLAVHADAVRWVAHSLPPQSIERCFFLYPNPEPKAPNRRWLRSPFLHRLLTTLKPGGEITLATNEQWYMAEARDWAAHAWGLEEIDYREITAGSPRTHFEKKYLARGQTCFDVKWRVPLE